MVWKSYGVCRRCVTGGIGEKATDLEQIANHCGGLCGTLRALKRSCRTLVKCLIRLSGEAHAPWSCPLSSREKGKNFGFSPGLRDTPRVHNARNAAGGPLAGDKSQTAAISRAAKSFYVQHCGTDAKGNLNPTLDPRLIIGKNGKKL